MGGSREERKECSPLRKLLKELRKKKKEEDRKKDLEEEIKARKKERREMVVSAREGTEIKVCLILVIARKGGTKFPAAHERGKLAQMSFVFTRPTEFRKPRFVPLLYGNIMINSFGVLERIVLVRVHKHVPMLDSCVRTRSIRFRCSHPLSSLDHEIKQMDEPSERC